MKSPYALGMVACLVVSGCGGAKNSSTNSPAKQIEAVLAADKQIGKQLSAEVNAGVSKRLAVGNAVTRMRAIDTSGCPTDFRTAYLRHCHAWMAAHQWLTSQPETDLEVFVDGFVQGLTGEYKSPDAEAQAFQETIRQAFEEVEVIAIRYGARTH